MEQAGGDATVAVNLTETDVTTTLKAFILSVLPFPMSVRLGQQNRVAAPIEPFVVMTIIGKRRLGTNSWTYSRTARVVRDPTEITVQVSCFGIGAGDTVQRIVALFRDFYATDFFAASGFDVAPLYAEDPRQTAFVSSEKQYEDQWSADLRMQANFILTVPQVFATSAQATAASVESLTSS